MRPRTVLVTVAACAVVLPSALAHGGSGARAHTSAAPKSCPGAGPKQPLLEVVNIDGVEDSTRLVAVGTSFDPGTMYTVVVCGVITRKITSPAGRTMEQDGFFRYHCVEGDGKPCPGGTAPVSSTHIDATDRRDRYPFARGGIQYFAQGGGGNPAYRSDHTYTLRLNDLGARMTLKHGVCCPGETRTGGFRVEIYGPPPKRYALTFSVRQRGEPAPEFPAGLSATDTVGGGKIFFSGVPKTGHKTSGTPAGVVNHTDEFLQPDLSTVEKETQARFTKAKYLKNAKGRTVELSGTIVSQAGTAKIHDGRDDAHVILSITDAVDDEDDSATWICEHCGDQIEAYHFYAHGPKNRLTVNVGVVRRVED